MIKRATTVGLPLQSCGILISALIFLTSCSSDNSSHSGDPGTDTDTDSDSDSDTNSDTDTHTGEDSDTDSHPDTDTSTDGDTDTNTGTDADTDSDTDLDAGPDDEYDGSYPDASYGFNDSVEGQIDPASLPTEPLVWTGEGDIIPNICLPNANGKVVCLGDFFESSEYEIILVNMTAMW